MTEQPTAAKHRPVKPWQEWEDDLILTYGVTVGLGFLASHDLRRPKWQVEERLEWMRENRPEVYEERWAKPKAGLEAEEAAGKAEWDAARRMERLAEQREKRAKAKAKAEAAVRSKERAREKRKAARSAGLTG
jgi:hypothetical protein